VSTRIQRPLARLIAAVVLLTVAAGCGGDELRQGSATTMTADADTGGRPGKLVEIGAGRGLFVHCVGSGKPTVVLETGFGADATQWQAVQPELGHGSQVCAYDRVGTGNSIARPGVQDAREEIADLRAWLARERIDPPYVLAGHSYGGILARVFAKLHPQETAGLVLIDTMGRDGRRRTLAEWPQSQARRLREEVAATRIGDVNLAVGEAIASSIKTLGYVPLAVIDAGRSTTLPQSPVRLRRTQKRLWARMHVELARLSDNSVHVTALRSNHYVPSSRNGQPSVVISAVQAVVQAARNGNRLAPCSRIFSGSDVRCPS